MNVKYQQIDKLCDFNRFYLDVFESFCNQIIPKYYHSRKKIPKICLNIVLNIMTTQSKHRIGLFIHQIFT